MQNISVWKSPNSLVQLPTYGSIVVKCPSYDSLVMRASVCNEKAPYSNLLKNSNVLLSIYSLSAFSSVFGGLTYCLLNSLQSLCSCWWCKSWVGSQTHRLGEAFECRTIMYLPWLHTLFTNYSTEAIRIVQGCYSTLLRRGIIMSCLTFCILKWLLKWILYLADFSKLVMITNICPY